MISESFFSFSLSRARPAFPDATDAISRWKGESGASAFP
jgi:hypothetical protein